MTHIGPTDMVLKSEVLVGVAFTILLTPPTSSSHLIMPESVPWLSLTRQKSYISIHSYESSQMDATNLCSLGGVLFCRTHLNLFHHIFSSLKSYFNASFHSKKNYWLNLNFLSQFLNLSYLPNFYDHYEQFTSDCENVMGGPYTAI